jgi:hypothetical protein
MGLVHGSWGQVVLLSKERKLFLHFVYGVSSDAKDILGVIALNSPLEVLNAACSVLQQFNLRPLLNFFSLVSAPQKDRLSPAKSPVSSPLRLLAR